MFSVSPSCSCLPLAAASLQANIKRAQETVQHNSFAGLQPFQRNPPRSVVPYFLINQSIIYTFIPGLVTIRALRATNRFRRDNEENVEINQKAQFASQAAGQWLGLRLQFIGVAMVAGVCFTAVVQHQYDVADPGTFLNFCQSLSAQRFSSSKQVWWDWR